MGGIFCLPTSEDTPAATAAHDRPGAEGASYLFAQDSLGGERRADTADDDSLTGTALFRSPPAAQGSGRRTGNVTGHPTVDDARSDADDASGDALVDAAGGDDTETVTITITGTADAAVIGKFSEWMSFHGADIRDLRAGAQRLEVIFRRLTADGAQ